MQSIPTRSHFEIYIDGLTESQLAELNELDKVWDYGKRRWVVIL